MVNEAFSQAFGILKSSLPLLLGTSPLDITVAPFLDFDPTTNRVILYADQVYYDETWAESSHIDGIEIYLNERLYDLRIGLPYKYVSITKELNYRLRVVYKHSNLVPKNNIVESKVITYKS